MPPITRSVLVALGAAAAAGLAAAAEPALPPEKPTTPYRAEVRNSYRISRPGGGESGADTLEIRVSGPRLFERPKIVGETTAIVDVEKREVIEFQEKGAEKVARRYPLNDAPIPYVGGRAALAAFDPTWPAPAVAGEDTVAGQKCTVLHYGKPDADGIAACVSKDGVVMRAKFVFPDSEREFELLAFDPGVQGDEHFAPPRGYRVVDGESE